MHLWLRWWKVPTGFCALLSATLWILCGCGPSPEAEQAAIEARKPADVDLGAPAPVPDDDEKTATAGTGAGGSGEDIQLRSPLTFRVPSAWKKVQPAISMIEAEYHLPKVADDEFDGRLTMMPASGSLQDNIKRWNGEFTEGTLHDSKEEKLPLAGKETTWIDLRGTWKGTAMRPMPPRKDYRMLAVIIPLDSAESFFIKLTGPQKTIAAHEEAFRTFVKSVRTVDKK